MGRHLPQGRGYKAVKKGKTFAAILIKWVRMNDRSSIVMLKVRHLKTPRA